MSRSLYKPNYVHKSLFWERLKKKNTLKKLKNFKVNKKQRYLHFWTKNSIITPGLVDKKISIYNGNNFISLNVMHKLLGYKLGSFCITRKKPSHAGKQKQRKKVSRLNIAEQRRTAIAKIQLKSKIRNKK